MLHPFQDVGAVPGDPADQVFAGSSALVPSFGIGHHGDLYRPCVGNSQPSLPAEGAGGQWPERQRAARRGVYLRKCRISETTRFDRPGWDKSGSFLLPPIQTPGVLGTKAWSASAGHFGRPGEREEAQPVHGAQKPASRSGLSPYLPACRSAIPMAPGPV